MEDEHHDSEEFDDDPVEVDAQFKQKPVYKSDELDTKIKSMKNGFYSWLESKQLIKKQGKVPFIEHMTLMHDKPVQLPEGAQVHDDLKRELVFYNLTLDNAKKGVEFLLQSKTKIGRPEDFFADMFKTDIQMKRIKNKLVSQQARMKNFEEKKQRLENKRFEKAIKAYKMK